ncbi:MAG: GHMP kinase [Candidatus Bathyarchaeota archaeon]|nr:MAG: GHMP kinase [Candidatus Bathyarchaeota archaeon]
MNEAKAFSPGHITGFFQVCDQSRDPLLKGSRGAGFSTSLGVATKVSAKKSTKNHVEILTPGENVKSASVSEHVVRTLLTHVDGNYEVHVEHDIKIPVGCGLGSSGAGSLSLALALNKVLDLKMPYLKAAQIAHAAEIKCKTGLGTVIDATFGGFQIRVEPGAPGIGETEPILASEDHVAVCLSFGKIPTSEILASKVARQRINELGGDLVEELVRHPSIHDFMKLSRRFAEHLGLVTVRMRKVLQETDRIGLECSMAMLGETIFSVVGRDQIEEILSIFCKYAPSKRSVIVTDIDFIGARLL